MFRHRDSALYLKQEQYILGEIYLLSQFKYFNNATPSKTSDMNPAELTKPDGNLELNIGKINIVFLYRFIAELMVGIVFEEMFPLSYVWYLAKFICKHFWWIICLMSFTQFPSLFLYNLHHWF